MHCNVIGGTKTANLMCSNELKTPSWSELNVRRGLLKTQNKNTTAFL